MFTKEELDSLHEDIFQRMLKAGWLLNFTNTKGKGWHLGWTEKGAERSLGLKKIAQGLGLQNDDRAPLILDIVSRGLPLPSYARPFEVRPLVATYWRESVDELAIAGDEDRLIIMVNAVRAWAPDADTPVKFV